MRSLSQDLRERFLDAVVAGASARAAGRRFALSPTTAIRWAKAWHAHGTHAAKPRGRQPGQGAKLAARAAFLLGLIEQQRKLRGFKGFITPGPNCTTVGLAIRKRMSLKNSPAVPNSSTSARLAHCRGAITWPRKRMKAI